MSKNQLLRITAWLGMPILDYKNPIQRIKWEMSGKGVICQKSRIQTGSGFGGQTTWAEEERG